MGQIFNFFPLSILKSKIEFSEEKKKKMLDEIFDMEKKSKNNEYKNQTSSWTGDTQGFEYIHNNPIFDDFFIEVKKRIIEYLDALQVDYEQLDIFIQRSWATISSGKEVISKHQHLQSHVSFAYYLKKISSDSNFIVYDEEKKNEFIPGLFGSKTLVQKKLIKEITLASATKISLPVNEDDIVIFPSKTLHSTDQIKTNNDRISISGDIIFLAKDTNTLEHLTPSFENWKKL